MTKFLSIREQLLPLGMFNEDTLVYIREGASGTIFDAQGNICSSDVFAGVKSAYAVLTTGEYGRAYSEKGLSIRASNDDMAMMFGGWVRNVKVPSGRAGAFLINGRGFLVTGRTVNELTAACILMEKMCKAETLGPGIGRVTHLNPLLCALEHTIYLKKYSKTSLESDGRALTQDDVESEKGRADIPDIELREEVIKYGKLLVENRLIQATWGNISVRIDDERFLITPSGVDYDKIRPEEIVEIRIDDGSYAEGLHPSSEKKLHRFIYMNRPDLSAVIHTHSANCQIFSACRKGLKAEGIDYPCANYSVSGSGKLAENVASVMVGHDGCIMANHGSVTAADTLKNALEKAINAEKAAGRLLGE